MILLNRKRKRKKYNHRVRERFGVIEIYCLGIEKVKIGVQDRVPDHVTFTNFCESLISALMYLFRY